MKTRLYSLLTYEFILLFSQIVIMSLYAYDGTVAITDLPLLSDFHNTLHCTSMLVHRKICI